MFKFKDCFSLRKLQTANFFAPGAGHSLKLFDIV